MIRYILLLMWGVLYALDSYQQDTTQSTLAEVIVTSQRSAQKELLIPYSVEKISAARLQQTTPRTTPEALTGLNGVFIQKTNHGGGSPFIRGLTGNQTLLLVDGIRINNSTFRYGPNQYLNTIDVFTIDRIEIAKGTGAVQYGSDAIGGVIQVLSKEQNFIEGKPRFSGLVHSKVATANLEQTGRIQGGYSAGKSVVDVGLTYRNFGDLVGGRTTGKQSPSGYNEMAFNAKGKFLLRPGIIMHLSHQQLTQFEVPVYHKIKLENYAINEFDRQQHMLQYLKFEIAGSNGLLNRIDVTLSNQNTNEKRELQKINSDLLRTEHDKVNTKGVTSNIYSILSNRWTANSGLEWYSDKVRSRRTDQFVSDGRNDMKRGLYPDGASYKNMSVYSLHQVNLKKWILDGGVRLNGFGISLSDSSLGKVKTNTSALVWNAGLLYKLSGSGSLYMSYSTGFRSPNIDDMGSLGIVDSRYELPANNLKAERSGNIEIGYKLNNGTVKGDVTAYQMNLTNLITRMKIDGYVISGYSVYTKENAEKAVIRGVETKWLWQPVKTISIAANVAYTFGQNQTKEEPLRRIPPTFGKLEIAYNKNKWYGIAEMLFASAQTRLAKGDIEDNRIGPMGTAGWQAFNVYVGNTFNKVRIATGIYNILNKDYRTHGSGINNAGRHASLAVTVAL